jgi:hypothetical protein
MKTVFRHAIALTALVACATPALADWEGTQWGMSPDEALAVLDGARSHSPDGSEIFQYDGSAFQPLVKLEHAIEGVPGEAALLFDADESLQFVTFSPEDLTQCDALTEALMDAYGSVESSGFGSTATYNWMDGGNVIRLTNSAEIGICNLSYGAQ